jgi:3-dehydroquinate synthetase
LTAKTGSGVAVVGVGIGGRVGIGASSGKDVFGPFRMPILLYRALSIVYSGGVGE